MYLYASEHALMDYHLNPKTAEVETEKPTEEVKEKANCMCTTPLIYSALATVCLRCDGKV